jgi:hypothetical protein
MARLAASDDGLRHAAGVIIKQGQGVVRCRPHRFEECDGKPVAKGLCAKHYMRMRRTGDPDETRKPGPKPYNWPVDFAYLSRRTRTRLGQAGLCLDIVKEKWGIDPKRVIEEAKARRRSGTIIVNRVLNVAYDLADVWRGLELAHEAFGYDINEMIQMSEARRADGWIDAPRLRKWLVALTTVIERDRQAAKPQ